MKHRPVREDYRRWLDAQRAATSATARGQTRAPATPAQPELPPSLPFAGYVVWFPLRRAYLDIRFDHQRFAIVTQSVETADAAFYFDHFDAAYGHATDIEEPCLILYAAHPGGPVRVAG
ncbi:hypothetical protein PCA31118_04445 [Pandoraea captiosa]|uniref:Uncharacterized protein n=1 Tax=Pandoraea captiosa TaxID=2508302 RepID=A0A5E5AKV8_9BURK|nr:hypothetical protein [Pandoraea captiosa]VVE73163.1 hypothetical protein PCA31118_04445 [Pandoraea captiosa]